MLVRCSRFSSGLVGVLLKFILPRSELHMFQLEPPHVTSRERRPSQQRLLISANPTSRGEGMESSSSELAKFASSCYCPGGSIRKLKKSLKRNPRLFGGLVVACRKRFLSIQFVLAVLLLGREAQARAACHIHQALTCDCLSLECTFGLRPVASAQIPEQRHFSGGLWLRKQRRRNNIS